MATDLYSDELRQLARLGMNQAAAMLSRLLRQPVRIDVAGKCQLVHEAVAGIGTKPQLGVYMPVCGELQGGLLLALSEDSAGWMGGHLLGINDCCELLVEPVSSTLKEIGNIIASAFLASIDSRLGVRALPEPPQLQLAPADQLLMHFRASDSKTCLLVRTDLLCGDEEVARGTIYLFPTSESLELLRARIVAVSLSEKSC